MSDQNMEIDISSEEEDRLLNGAEEYDLFIAEPIENLPKKVEIFAKLLFGSKYCLKYDELREPTRGGS